jgi:hypothetical protein
MLFHHCRGVLLKRYGIDKLGAQKNELERVAVVSDRLAHVDVVVLLIDGAWEYRHSQDTADLRLYNHASSAKHRWTQQTVFQSI